MTTDGVWRLTLMIGKVDAELFGKQIAGKDRIGAGIDQTVQQRCALTLVGERDLHERPEYWLTESGGVRILSVRIQPRQWRQVRQGRRESARPGMERGHVPRRGCGPSPFREPRADHCRR